MIKDQASIKNNVQYEELRKKGISKQKAARIANDAGGGLAEKHEYSSKKEIYGKAKEVGIGGRSYMSKKELIEALKDL